MIFQGCRLVFQGFRWVILVIQGNRQVFTMPDCFLWFLRFQVSIFGSRMFFMVFQGPRYVFCCSRLVFMVCQGSRFVFHGSKWVFKVSDCFFLVPGPFFMVYQGSRLVFHGFKLGFMACQFGFSWF